MKRLPFAALLLLGSLLIPLAAAAAEIRAFVTDFTVSPAEASELKGTLKRLLSSRLAGEGLSVVDAASEADVIVSGSYTQLGKVFSLDAVARTAAGKQITATFEQGDGMDGLIPAVGTLSAKLRGEIVKRYQALQAPARELAAPAQTAPAPAAIIPAPVVKAPSPGSAEIEKVPATEIVRKEATPGTLSQRIEGSFCGLAPLGANEYLLGEGRTIRLYRQGTKVTLLDEKKLHPRLKILGVDSLYPDQEGRTLAFVTIVDGELPSSKIYALEKDKLKLVQENLPYLFRSIAVNGGAKKLFVQQMGNSDDFYGDVYEASYQDGKLELGRALKMPRFANIFNFNTFRDQAGNGYLTAFSEGGYLIVYNEQGEELWRSEEKFGGSETYFQRRDADERLTGSPFRTRFIDQRITVTGNGEILVPQNTGFFVIGNARTYSKYSVVSLAWNGSSLEERWRTKQNQHYLADYVYNPGSKELVLLEVVQRGGITGKGGSAIRVMRAE